MTNKAAESALAIRAELCASIGDSGLSEFSNNEGRVWFDEFLNEFAPEGFYASKMSERADSILIGLYIASEINNKPANTILISALKDRTIALNGINNDAEGSFVVTSMKIVHKSFGTNSSRAVFVPWGITSGYSIEGCSLSAEIIKQIEVLELAGLAKSQVEDRLSDWEGYLAIIQKIAEESSLTIPYTAYQHDKELRYITFFMDPKSSIEWERLSRLRGQEFYSIDQFEFGDKWRDSDLSKQLIGYLDSYYKDKNAIRFEMDLELLDLLHDGKKLPFLDTGFLNYTARGDIVQAKRLRFGIANLINGKAANPKLERFLFDPTLANNSIQSTPFCVSRGDLLMQNLNGAQLNAVNGAITADDLFLVQGPPGTGKTTVIAEICYQAIKNSKKVLVASQSNLAVDNALSKLIHHPTIRILRKGKSDKVEDEGLPFIEQNVINTWLKNTALLSRKQLEHWENRVQKLLTLQNGLSHTLDLLVYRSQVKKQLSTHNVTLDKLSNSLEVNTQQLSELNIWHQRRLQFIENDSDNLPNDFLEFPSFDFEELKEYKKHFVDISETRKYINSNNIIYNATKQARQYIESIEINKVTDKNYPVSLAAFFLSQSMQDSQSNIVKQLYDKTGVLNQLATSFSQIEQFRSKLTIDDLATKELADRLAGLYNEVSKNRYIATEGSLNQTWSFDQHLSNSSKTRNELQAHIAKKPGLISRFIGLHRKWLTNTLSLLSHQGELKLHSALLFQSFLEDQSKILANFTLTRSDIIDNIQQLSDLILQEGEALAVRLISTKAQISSAFGSLSRVLNSKIQTQSSELNCLQAKESALQTELLQTQDAISEFNSQVIDAGFKLPQFDSKYTREKIGAVYSSLWAIDMEKSSKVINLLEKWIARISSPTKADEDKLRKHYIDNCNVIGTTCVQCGSREFSEEYPVFDIVIIDEVSKATPPELLLPMLKGKKIVLVGDHKQLPPMVDSETLEDLAQQQGIRREEYSHLERSLFKELYEAAPENMKCMLNIQYRMHPVIMNCINQFYIDHRNGGLSCGIPDVDQARSHNCEGGFLTKEHHGLWIDTKMKPENFELTAGTSFQNPEEIRVIKKILEEMAVSFRKNRANNCEKKEIGVITFYSAQARHLRSQLEGYLSDVFKLRIGTVDRFQGIEKPIVIVSLVRNNSSGKIGFAKKPQRINVAFSRAKELLIVVGCSELFINKYNGLKI